MRRTSAEAAASDLVSVIGVVKSGSLRIYGDWFGRPYDNVHVVQSVLAQGDELVVGFDANETLRVSAPESWEFSRDSFRIQNARRVVWEWFSYGSSQTPENLLTIEHWVDDDGTIHASSDQTQLLPAFAPSKSDAAVELL